MRQVATVMAAFLFALAAMDSCAHAQAPRQISCDSAEWPEIRRAVQEYCASGSNASAPDQAMNCNTLNSTLLKRGACPLLQRTADGYAYVIPDFGAVFEPSGQQGRWRVVQVGGGF